MGLLLVTDDLGLPRPDTANRRAALFLLILDIGEPTLDVESLHSSLKSSLATGDLMVATSNCGEFAGVAGKVADLDLVLHSGVNNELGAILVL